MEQEHFSKAPINEAMIDLRVQPREGIAVTDLEGLVSVTTERYVQQQELFTDQFSFQITEQAKVETSRQRIGLRFIGRDQREILQARLDGFTFSVLRPYDRWEPFRGEAQRLWNAYRDIVSPYAVRRVGVRYINRIDIPQPSISPRDYLRTFPENSSDAPDQVQNYFMQLHLLVPDLNSVTLINQTIVPPPQPNMVSIVLDIELYREIDVPQDETGIWALFEQFRVRKNAIFRACLTERTKDLIR